MRTMLLTNDSNPASGCRYALCRGVDYWALAFEGREAIFKHRLGALYVAYLLVHPPKEPLHAVALALKAREMAGKPAGPDEVLEEQSMRLEDAAAVRALWRRQRELERVMGDRHEIEPVRAEALRELEEVTEFLRLSPWLSRHGAERCVRAVTIAIRRFHADLTQAVDNEGKPNAVLQAFARHLDEHLLIRSGLYGGIWAAWVPAGCFTYEPPAGVVWEGQSTVPSSPPAVHSLESEFRRPAAMSYLSRFLCAGFALAMLVSGCAGRPLKGGKAAIARKPAGVIEQTLTQSENPSQAAKQDQETVKVRTYTVPAGSRVEESQAWEGERPREPKLPRSTVAIRAREDARPPGSPQPSTVFVLSAPMPVVEHEETRARTELGAAQKDTARELGAKLASLKGIVWVGVGLFVFGLASLVYPPLKVIVASVTTSAALMLGGLALVILPTMVVGNELLILGVVALVVGGWFLAHRHGELRGVVAASTSNGEQKTETQSP